jgi:hypothetical protein
MVLLPSIKDMMKLWMRTVVICVWKDGDSGTGCLPLISHSGNR